MSSPTAPMYMPDNWINSTTVISASSEDEDWPMENVFSEDQANVFRFTDNAGGYIEFDLLAAKNLGAIAIMNLPQASSIVVTAGNSPGPVTVVATPTWRNGGVWASLASVTARYVRVTVVFSGTTTPQIGHIRICPPVQLLRNFNWDYDGGLDEGVLERETERGVTWVFKQFSRDFFQYDFFLNQAELDEMEEMHLAVDGRVHPFVWIPNKTETPVYFVRKQAGFKYKKVVAINYYRHTMVLQGESRGIEVRA